MNLYNHIASIPNYPIEGVLFRDITPLLQNGEAFSYAVTKIADYARSKGAELIVAPDARGFIVGAPVANMLKIGFVPVRKPGKLPRKTISTSYSLEYGTNTLEMCTDAIKPGQKVVVVDDLLATGGTIEASIKMVEQLGGEVVGTAFLIDLIDLKGRERLSKYDVFALMQYEGE